MKYLAQTILIAIPVVVFAWLFTMDLTPSGRFTVHHQIQDPSPFIDRILPDTRALEPQDSENGYYQSIIDEPVYVSLHSPGNFEKLEAELLFKNLTQPILELGILVGEDPLQYELKPVQNLLIDNSDWDRLEENGLVLLQRARMYSSINDFLNNLPTRDSIASYHYEFDQPYREIGYQPASKLTTTKVSLRGYHEFLTYIKNEPLMLEAKFQDMNRQVGEDSVSLLVFDEQGSPVAEQIIEDDGVVDGSGAASSRQTATLVVNNLPEGVYKVILKAGDDIFFRELTTRQRYMTFVGPVYIGDEVGYLDDHREVRFFTDAKNLSFYTYHADAAQQVNIGEAELLMPEAQVRYDYNVDQPGLVDIYASSGDFRVTHNSKIAFQKSQFFNPDPIRLNWNTDLDDLGINYVIAGYESPKDVDGWKSQKVAFDLAGALNNEGDYKLVIGAPGISSLQGQVDIHAINLTYTRPELTPAKVWSKIKDGIKKIL